MATIPGITILSAVRVVHSGLFAKMSPSEQTALLATEPNKPVMFVPTFAVLADKKVLIQKLLAGADVSLELEYNKIVLSEEEVRAFAAVRPILERINALGSQYPWLPHAVDTEYTIVYNKASVRRNGYSIGHHHIRDIWAKASAYWGGHTTNCPEPYNIEGGAGYHSAVVTITSNQVRIGCQTIRRVDVEEIAKKLELEPSNG